IILSRRVSSRIETHPLSLPTLFRSIGCPDECALKEDEFREESVCSWQTDNGEESNECSCRGDRHSGGEPAELLDASLSVSLENYCPRNHEQDSLGGPMTDVLEHGASDSETV